MFCCEFCEIFQNSLFTEHLRVIASDNSFIAAKWNTINICFFNLLIDYLLFFMKYWHAPMDINVILIEVFMWFDCCRSSPSEVFWKYAAIYRRTPMPKYDFNKVAWVTLWHEFSPVNCCIFSQHLFLRTPLGCCFYCLQQVNCWNGIIYIWL